MSKEKTKTIGKGLEALAGVDLTLPVPEPELPDVEFGDLTASEARAQKIREAAEKYHVWVRKALTYFQEVKKASREAQELEAEKFKQAKDGLNRLLSHDIPAYRRAVWLGLLEHEFSQELNSRTEVEELLDRLVREGRLKEDPSGSLQAYHKAYAISPDSFFGDSETTEVTELFSKLISRVFQETGKTHKEKTQELQAQGSSDIQDLVAGKPGKYAVKVPAEKVDQNGQTFWRGGGTLLVEVNGQGDILPLDSSGSIEGAVEETRALRVFLKAYTLSWNWPPKVDWIDEQRVRKLHLLWHLLKRAIRYKENEERVAKAKEALVSRTTINAQEFFLDKKLGICLVDFYGDWQNPDGSAGPTNLFFLVERFILDAGDEENPSIRIVDAPEHLNGFFAQCMGEYTEKGDLPSLLWAVLKATSGQALKASKDADKAGLVAK